MTFLLSNFTFLQVSASREEEEEEDYGISNLLLDEVQNVTLVKEKNV